MNESTLKSGGIVFGLWVIMSITLGLTGMPMWISLPAPLVIVPFMYYKLEYNRNPDEMMQEAMFGKRR